MVSIFSKRKRFIQSFSKLSNLCKFFSTVLPPYKEEKVTVLDAEINVIQSVENDSNAPPIFVLPGSFGSIEMDFKPILQECNRKKYKWICWDPPGYGKSRPPNSRPFMSERNGNVYERDTKYIKELLTMFGYDNYTLLASSGAAFSAMIIAAEQPEKVSGLVTWAAFGYIGQDIVSNMKVIKNRELSDVLSKTVHSQLINMYGEDLLQEMWNGWCDEAIKMGNSTRFSKGGSFQQVCSNVQCPVLVMHGVKDVTVNYSYAHELKASLKNSRLNLWPNGTHGLPFRELKAFVECVQQFVDQTTMFTRLS